MPPASRATDVSAPSRSLASYLDAAVLTATAGETAAVVRARLAADRFAAVDPVFVLGPARRFLGAVPLTVLLGAEGEAAIEGLARADWPVVPATLPCEEAASLAIRTRTPALAVIDHAGAFLGALTPEALMAILRDEHLEDLHLMVGILGRSEAAKEALTAAPHRRALFRLPWLLVGLAGSVAATALMADAEAMLAGNIALAFFVPALVYLSDAIGTQAEAVAVRGLSFSDGPTGSLLIGEVLTGAVLGVALALCAFAGVLVWFGDARLAATVALALAVAGTVATAVGFSLPWAFQRIGLDPAYGSGPLATVFQYVLTIALYLALARLLMT
ncbi:MAG: magnesium transporter [Elioraea sp.]|nr:magnesium transporter [Elioraea sp.]MDW8443208.1 magnesium transporter [Acetobacteraceae bacterium]